MPCAAWVAEMPSSPISVAVSKPRPNRKPIGYMCQERDTTPNIGRKIAREKPAAGEQGVEILVDDLLAAAWRARTPPRCPRRMKRLASPMASRKNAETRVPMTPPIVVELLEPALHRRRGRRDDDRGEHHDRGMAERKEEADRKRLLALLHQLAHDIVDGGDVVGIEGVAQAEHVGEERRAKEGRLVGERDPGPEPGRGVGGDQQRKGRQCFDFDARGPIVEWIRQYQRGLLAPRRTAASQV